MSSIADRLRAEREARGLTQPQVADCVGASKRTVQHWESGVSAPTAGDLSAMALLGFDVRYVITGNRDYVPPPPIDAEEQALLLHWRAASRPAKNAALGALLGAGLGRQQSVEQVFNAGVGQVVQGNSSHSRVVLTDQSGRYPVKGAARKSTSRKP